LTALTAIETYFYAASISQPDLSKFQRRDWPACKVNRGSEIPSPVFKFGLNRVTRQQMMLASQSGSCATLKHGMPDAESA